MRVLVACEFSGVVRDAFIRHGHDAISCDLLPSESDFGPHALGDIQQMSYDWLTSFDLLIAHPPCTYLAVSGNAWRGRPERTRLEHDAFLFVVWLANLRIPRIAIENPVGTLSTLFRPPDDYIQPYQFGHPYRKKTGLWLHNLPTLIPTDVVPLVDDGSGNESTGSGSQFGQLYGPSPDRWKLRSRTFAGVADAMAAQWGEPSKYTHVFRDGEHIIFNQELTAS